MKWLASALLLSVLASGAAGAHLGGASGVSAFFDDDGTLVGAGTTFGLISVAADGTLSQTCDEAIADALPRAFVRLGRHTISASIAGVFASDDGVGCNWAPVPLVGDRSVQVVVPSSTSSNTLWAVTADGAAAGLDPIANIVVRLRDEGRAEEALEVERIATAAPGVLLTSLVVAAVEERDVVVVAGVDLEARRPFFAIVDDENAGVIELQASQALAEAQLVRVLEVGDGQLLFSTLDIIGRGHLFTASFADVVASIASVNTTNGAEAVDVDVVEVGAFDGLVNASVVFAGHRYVSAGSGIVFRAPLLEGGVGPFERVESPIVACLLVQEGALLGCTTNADGYFVRSVDGEVFEPFVARGAVVDHVCPAGSAAAAACAYRFLPPTVDDDDDDDDDDDEPVDDGCAQGGMSGTSPLASVLVLMLMLVLGRMGFLTRRGR